MILRSRDGHGIWLNRYAMELVPEAWTVRDPLGGKIGRGADGAPGGDLYDAAMDPALVLANTRDAGTLSRRILRAVQRCAQAGLKNARATHRSRHEFAELAASGSGVAGGELHGGLGEI